MITQIRVDDRLIHGQVAVVCKKSSDANDIKNGCTKWDEIISSFSG